MAKISKTAQEVRVDHLLEKLEKVEALIAQERKKIEDAERKIAEFERLILSGKRIMKQYGIAQLETMHERTVKSEL